MTVRLCFFLGVSAVMTEMSHTDYFIFITIHSPLFCDCVFALFEFSIFCLTSSHCSEAGEGKKRLR